MEEIPNGLFAQVQPEDLLHYGLIPEFVGRLPVIATLEELDEASLVRILTEPKNALTKQYQKLLSFDKVKLKFTEGALGAIAQKAYNQKTGARGLRAIIGICHARCDVRYPFSKRNQRGANHRRSHPGKGRTYEGVWSAKGDQACCWHVTLKTGPYPAS